MTPAQRCKLDSVDTKTILDSPEAFEIVDALLKLYRDEVRNGKRQEETIRSLLDRLYGSKSEKSKYHPQQMLLLPELLEELAAAAKSCDGESDDKNGGEADKTPETSEKNRFFRRICGLFSAAIAVSYALSGCYDFSSVTAFPEP